MIQNSHVTISTLKKSRDVNNDILTLKIVTYFSVFFKT